MRETGSFKTKEAMIWINKKESNKRPSLTICRR